MRQDPDIIMVGEIRDLETAEVAIQAALDRPPRAVHPAYQRCAGGVTRMLDLGVPPYLIALDLAWRHGATSGAHALPPLQAAGRLA
jgi:type II secretory ATPase GspE/PulE/Tfp pilus assembly ATPase PilB-like protein